MSKRYTPKLRRRKQRGLWVEYTRKTLEDIPDFVGWPIILRLLQEALRTNYYPKRTSGVSPRERRRMRRELRYRDQALEVAAFLIGGRVSETLMSHADNFILQKDRIIVTGLPLLKRYEVVREELRTSFTPPTDAELAEDEDYEWDKERQLFVVIRKYTESQIIERKDFPIPTWEEPLVGILLRRIKWAKLHAEETDSEYAWLFPTSRKPTRREDPGVQRWVEERFGLEVRAWISPERAYQVVRMLGERLGLQETLHLWNHWWRSQRASQLGEEYEFEDPHLNAYFGWVGGMRGRPSTASRYSRTGVRRIWRRMVEGRELTEQSIKLAMREVKWE